MAKWGTMAVIGVVAVTAGIVGHKLYVTYKPQAPTPPTPPGDKPWAAPAAFGKCLDPSQGGGAGCPWIPGCVPPSVWKPPTITSSMTVAKVVAAFAASAGGWVPPVGWIPGATLASGHTPPAGWICATGEIGSAIVNWIPGCTPPDGWTPPAGWIPGAEAPANIISGWMTPPSWKFGDPLPAGYACPPGWTSAKPFDSRVLECLIADKTKTLAQCEAEAAKPKFGAAPDKGADFPTGLHAKEGGVVLGEAPQVGAILLPQLSRYATPQAYGPPGRRRLLTRGT